MLICHLSDPHLFSSRGLAPVELLNKRLLGFLNWYRKRRYRTDHGLLPTLEQKVASVSPDRICLTGDLVHLGRRDEFILASAMLERLSATAPVTIVPGNHDFYIEKSIVAMEQVLGGRFGLPSGLGPCAAGQEAVGLGQGCPFPVSAVVGRCLLISLCSAYACPILEATGRLGQEQLDSLELLLADGRAKGLMRIVSIHHAPLDGLASRRRSLLNSEKFLGVIRRNGCELVLFGHIHKRYEGVMRHGAGSTLFVSAPALFSTLPSFEERGGFNLLQLGGKPGGWKVSLERYVLDGSNGSMDYVLASRDSWRL